MVQMIGLKLQFLFFRGELAQLVERVLCMHEVAGSIPAFSMR